MKLNIIELTQIVQTESLLKNFEKYDNIELKLLDLDSHDSVWIVRWKNNETNIHMLLLGSEF